jgi:hypothetical protein
MPDLIKTTLSLAYFYSASLKKKESLITLELGKGGNSPMFSFLQSSHHHFKVKPFSIISTDISRRTTNTTPVACTINM